MIHAAVRIPNKRNKQPESNIEATCTFEPWFRKMKFLISLHTFRFICSVLDCYYLHSVSHTFRCYFNTLTLIPWITTSKSNKQHIKWSTILNTNTTTQPAASLQHRTATSCIFLEAPFHHYNQICSKRPQIYNILAQYFALECNKTRSSSSSRCALPSVLLHPRPFTST